MSSKVSNINIETERLFLRNMKPEDVTQDYADWLNDPQINRYLSCAGSVQTKESCISYVKFYENKGDVALIGIFSKDKSLHIGNITASLIDWHNKAVTLGISLGREECMGQGLATEALSATVTYFFKELKLHRVQACVHLENERSSKLFSRCGFKIEGTLRESGFVDGRLVDAYMFSVLESDL